MSFGFIIPCYISDKANVRQLLQCLRHIRKIYKEKIVVIDDGSPVDVSKVVTRLARYNITYEKATVNAAELNPYIHFHRNKYFDRAIIIHDSVYIKRALPDTSNMKHGIKFLWPFLNHRYAWSTNAAPATAYNVKNSIKNYDDLILDLAAVALPNNEFKKQIRTQYFNKDNWVGCAGTMSVITHSFLVELESKTGILAVGKQIRNRMDRISLESLFALACFYTGKINVNDLSFSWLYGHDIVPRPKLPHGQIHWTNPSYMLYETDYFTKVGREREKKN